MTEAKLQQAEAEVGRDTFEGARIMLVDDEPTTLEVVEVFLCAEGYENIIKVIDSRRAVAIAAETRPDLVLLDLMMPAMGGLDVLREMRSHPPLASVPVIILSSSTDADEKLRALELGASEFLNKPVDPSELALRVRKTLAFKAYQDRFVSGAERGVEFLERLDRALRGPGPPVVSRLASDPRFRATIGKFIGRLDEKLECMQSCLAQDELPELAELARWLKGAAGMVGFDAFTGPADTLELVAREGKKPDAEALLRELNALADRIVAPAADGG